MDSFIQCHRISIYFFFGNVCLILSSSFVKLNLVSWNSGLDSQCTHHIETSKRKPHANIINWDMLMFGQHINNSFIHLFISSRHFLPISWMEHWTIATLQFYHSLASSANEIRLLLEKPRANNIKTIATVETLKLIWNVNRNWFVRITYVVGNYC